MLPRRKPIRLLPYQQLWLDDDSRFKIACKARQIGFTFAATLRVLHKRRQHPGLTLWLSASERQALEAMEYIRLHAKVLSLIARHEETFIEGTQVKQRQVRLPNGSRIIALPANPDTVRGFAGDVVLDEFAFHRDAEAIWRAAFATATRGFQIEIISTPNGTRGKYYELAKAAGLVEYSVTRGLWPVGREKQSATLRLRSGQASNVQRASKKTNPVTAEAQRMRGKRAGEEAAGGGLLATTQPSGRSRWAEQSFLTGHRSRATSHGIFSPHWVDLAEARAQGFRVDVEALRAAIGDQDAWEQEYCCRFLSDAAHYIPPELVAAAESTTASTMLPVAGATGLGEESTQSWRVRPLGLTSERPREAHPGMGSGETLSGFPQRLCYLGVDIGRKRDLTVLWLLEEENPEALPEARTYVTRGVLTLDRQPFAQQRAALDALLSDRTSRESPFASRGAFLVQRCALDASGLGAMLAEELATKWGARVEPVVFTGAVKEALAVRVKRLLEERRLKIPYDPAIRAALGSVKRFVTAAGNVRFDAERTDASGHADHFWALALALHVAEEPGVSVEYVSSARPRASALAHSF